MSSYDLAVILENLRYRVPAPYVPPPVSQDSWAGLKPGQRLRSLAPVGAYVLGTLFVIEATDNQGMSLQPPARWTDRNWAAAFAKEKKLRAPKKKS